MSNRGRVRVAQEIELETTPLLLTIMGRFLTHVNEILDSNNRAECIRLILELRNEPSPGTCEIFDYVSNEICNSILDEFKSCLISELETTPLLLTLLDRFVRQLREILESNNRAECIRLISELKNEPAPEICHIFDYVSKEICDSILNEYKYCLRIEEIVYPDSYQNLR